MDIRTKKKGIKRKKRVLTKAAIKKRKSKIKIKKKKKKPRTSQNITINLNVSNKALPPYRKRRRQIRRVVPKSKPVYKPVNASEYRAHNTFYKPSALKGNSMSEIARGGSVIPQAPLNFGAPSGAVEQLKLDIESSKRVNTVSGRNVYKEESDIRKIMTKSGNLATLTNVKNWIIEEGYPIQKSMRKKAVIEYIISSPDLSKLFIEKDWTKIPVPTPLLRPPETPPFTDEVSGRTRSKTKGEINFDL